MCINADDVETDTSLSLSPPTDLCTVKYQYFKIQPQTSSITPIQVDVERQSDPIDLSRSFV